MQSSVCVIFVTIKKAYGLYQNVVFWPRAIVMHGHACVKVIALGNICGRFQRFDTGHHRNGLLSHHRYRDPGRILIII